MSSAFSFITNVLDIQLVRTSFFIKQADFLLFLTIELCIENKFNDICINNQNEIIIVHCKHHSIKRRVFRNIGLINTLAKHWSVIIGIQYNNMDDCSARSLRCASV
uniref:Uncharacterized protein n=1 Tax=Myripristis murdjan TaxID=586833 RepID=A0A667WTM1_9TELE